MRRLFAYPAILALLLTATFAGCRQEPLPEAGDAIRFSVSNAVLSAETKADCVDDIKNETVLLYGSMAGATDPVFNGTELNYSTETNKWAYSPLKYWVQNGTYDFRAICPSTYPSGITVTGSSSEIKVSNFSIGNSFDLMVAAKTGVTSADPAGTGDSFAAVPLAFKHACAAVRFLFQDGTNDYYIKSFTLSGITTSGTVTYNSDNEATPSTWWGSLGTTAYSLSDLSWSVPTDYTGIETGWYFVVPQNLGDDAKLSFTYKVGSDGTQVIPVTIPLKGGEGVNTSSVTSWDRANAYTYKIQIQANAIEFTVSVDPWIETTDTSLVEPEPTI